MLVTAEGVGIHGQGALDGDSRPLPASVCSAAGL